MAGQQKWYQRIPSLIARNTVSVTKGLAKRTVAITKYLAKRFDAMHESDSDSDSTHVVVHKKLYTLFIFLDFGLLLAFALFVPGLRYWLLAIAALQFALSWRIVGNQFIAGLTVFEIPFAEPKTGPVFVLFPIAQLILVPKAPQQFQFPDEPEWVFNGDDRDPLPMKTINGVTREMVRPYRVISGKPRDDYKSHLNIQMTTKATGTVKFSIEQIFDFWTRIAGRNFDEKIVEIRRQMYDTWSDTVVEEYEQRPIGLVIDEGKEIRKNLRINFEEATNSSGVRIWETTLRSPDLGHDLSASLSEIGEANAKGEQTRVSADAAKYATVAAGDGAAQADLLKRRAEADGAAYEAEKLGLDGAQVFAARTGQQIFGDNDKFVFGLGGITEAVGAAAELIKGAKKAPEGDRA